LGILEATLPPPCDRTQRSICMPTWLAKSCPATTPSSRGPSRREARAGRRPGRAPPDRAAPRRRGVPDDGTRRLRRAALRRRRGTWHRSCAATGSAGRSLRRRRRRTNSRSLSASPSARSWSSSPISGLRCSRRGGRVLRRPGGVGRRAAPGRLAEAGISSLLPSCFRGQRPSAA